MTGPPASSDKCFIDVVVEEEDVVDAISGEEADFAASTTDARGTLNDLDIISVLSATLSPPIVPALA